MTETPTTETPTTGPSTSPPATALGGGSTGPSANTRMVPTRRVALEQSFHDVPRHFAAGGDLLHSHFAAALSALFPDGEDFFVRSVRRYRDKVTDPDLKRQVAGFIGQEAMHGREHRAFNARLAEVGFPTKLFGRLTKRALALRDRLAPPISNLAATAALEHFTATMAELLLENEEVQALFGNQPVKDLFMWHALEEAEHKAVAFDVYRAVGGGERLRVVTMKMLRIGFVVVMTLQMACSLLADRDTYRRGVLLRSWRSFRRSPLVSRETWSKLREYDRRGFHPDDRDTAALVEHWREELFGEHGSMRSKLAGSTTSTAA